MEYVQFYWVDYMLFSLMFGLSALTGIYFGWFKKQNTTEDYLRGGGQMKVFPVAMSLAASTVSGIAILGIPTEIYMYGTQYWMMVFAMIFVGLIIYFIFLPVLYKLQLTSIFEYLEIRFDKRLRTLFSVLFTITNGFFLPILLYAPSLAFNQVSGFNIYASAAIISVICIFYTTFGGVKAVVWADTLQFIITLFTLTFVLIKGVISVGGLSVIWEKAEQGNRLEFFNMDLDPTLRATFWSIILGNIGGWTVMVGANQAMMQRFLAVPTYADSKMILIIYIASTIVIQSVVCFLGLVVYAKYNTCDPLTAGYISKPDQIVPYFIADIAREIPGISGLFVCGLFTTALSTLSSFLNSISANIYSDLVSLIVSADNFKKFSGIILKLITVIVGIIAMGLILIVERLGTILQMMLGLGGLYGGPLVGLYLMGMIFPIANKQGAFYGSLSSIIIMKVLVLGNQIMTWNGFINAIPRSLVTYGCNASDTSWNATSMGTAEYFYKTSTSSSVSGSGVEDEAPFWLFNITFYYYMFIGATLTIIIGVFVSYMTKSDADPLINLDLLCPVSQRLLRKSGNVKFRNKLNEIDKRELDRLM